MVSHKEVPPLQTLPGVGKQIAKHLSRLNIHSVADLLFHLPIRYQDRTHIQPISLLSPGEVVIEGEVTSAVSSSQGRTKLLCEMSDGTGKVQLRFFHVLPFQAKSLKPGTRLRCYGDVRLGSRGFEMIHPEYKILIDGKPLPVEPYLTAFYPSTEGLSQYTLRKLMTTALTWLESENVFSELLPETLIESFKLPTLREAILAIHKPPQPTPIDELLGYKTASHRRLIFEELLAYRISLLNIKKTFQSQSGVSLTKNEKLTHALLEQLPFNLTNAQARVIKTVTQDLMKAQPMLRLVQGDVGSGKTVIAALAMLQAVENGYQAAMMAPTELLAEQHYRVFKRWLEPLGVEVIYLAGNVKGRARTDALNSIEKGKAQITLGTHALFQEKVNFCQLALVVVDEQHRFGVHQRSLFKEKGSMATSHPHQLIMTATPIPRTLAMSLYADLDCSTIDELPPGRTPISTSVMMNLRRDEVVARIRDACGEGRQAYWVCPLIDESETLACQSAIQMFEQLQVSLPTLKVGLIHGRMRSEDKVAIMSAFKAGEVQLLVATTVIEVGVDVPNASLMVIENAERLGLSQLHQLRGRVGRGGIASHCVLLYQHPLSNVAKERLTVMRETTDGFKIAQRDLELRGPGEVLGVRQTGDVVFHFADLVRDSELIPGVQQAADVIMQHHAEVVSLLEDRWIGQKKHYVKV